MALIVETGAALSNSDSYASVAFADAYHTARGREAEWLDLDPEIKEKSLRLATDFMVQRYRRQWAGIRKTATQRLDWPRYGADIPDSSFGAYKAYYAVDFVPREVQEACAELALRASTGVDLSPDLQPPTLKETVGPITIEYADGARKTVRYEAVDNLLGPLLRFGGGSMGRVVRG